MTPPTPRPLLRLLGVLFVFLFALLPLAAQKNKDFNDANVQLGFKTLQNNTNPNKALKHFKTALKKNPRNGYAHYFIGFIQLRNENPNSAVTSFELAFKYLPKNDKSTRAATLSILADTHLSLADTTTALTDLDAAILLEPEESNYLMQRANLYYETGNYDLSDDDYERMAQLDKDNFNPYMGLGRNAMAREDYDRAVTFFDRVVQLAPEFNYGYSYRAEAHLLRRDYPHAVEDCTSALSLLWDDVDVRAYQVFRILCDSAATTLRARLKVLHNKEPQKQKWLYYLYTLEDHLGNYGRAVNYRLEKYAMDPSAGTANGIATDLNSLGLTEAAVAWAARAEEENSSSQSTILLQAELLTDLRRYDEANAALDRAQAIDAEDASLYLQRSLIHSEQKNYEAAVEAMDMALSLSEETAFLHDLRGRLLLKMGQKERAAEDFRRELALYSTSPFALYFLGQPKAATARMDSIMAKGDDKQAYNAACVYALCGNKQQALTYLERALKSRKYTDFDHIDTDSDLDGLRNDADFKALVKQYRDAWEAHLAAERKLLDPRATEGAKSESTADTSAKPAAQKTDKKATAAAPHGVSEIAFTHSGGVTQVPCTINGLPLHFVFDTGASEVTLSSVEAQFMFKNGYLKPSDVIGRRAYLTASGDVVEGTSVRLHSVTFGGLTLNNVRASITHSQAAPLLLGQSVLSRLGKVEIDNQANVLRITKK